MLDFALNGYTFVMSLACHATKNGMKRRHSSKIK